MITLYLDMDGVVADFETAFGQKKFDKVLFRKKILEENLFENLPLMPNALDLVATCEQMISGVRGRIMFLSSLGSPTDVDLQNEVARQKNIWIEKNGFSRFRPIYVAHKGLKKRFATPHDILVDDTEQNIFDWEENFGKGIFYKDENILTHESEIRSHVYKLVTDNQKHTIIR